MPGATVRQCAILVGGLGTRLGAITADTPKPILSCGDRPFLAWLMREMIRFGIRDFLLLTGHLSERLEAALPGILAGLPMEVTVTLSREPVRAGTGGALFHALPQLQEEFLLCNGDSFFDCNIAQLLAEAAARPDLAAHIVVREVADASRYGVVELSGGKATAFHARPPASAVAGPGVINAGIYRIRREAVKALLAPVCSLEQEVLPVLAAQGQLGATLCNGYFIDIGIPEDLARARAELPARLRRPVLFLDRDGVLNHDHGWVGTRERFEWIEGAVEAIARATAAGWHVFVVTNQSGVARGFYDEAAVGAMLEWMADTARLHGGTIDDWRFCPFHPEAPLPAYRKTSDWRKPAPGMLQDLLRAWEPAETPRLLVGDQPTDLQAAAAAGVKGHLFTGGNLQERVCALLEDAGVNS
ncbi:HAD-IIIA family hydrolase [Roseomonas sp. ACRSG]|nr:HAD-IIIA family hydrolase [Roseomonas sp. ACRSG]